MSGPSRQGPVAHTCAMFGAIRNLLLYRVLGGRIMLAMWLIGAARRLIGRRRAGGAGPGGAGRV